MPFVIKRFPQYSESAEVHAAGRKFAVVCPRCKKRREYDDVRIAELVAQGHTVNRLANGACLPNLGIEHR